MNRQEKGLVEVALKLLQLSNKDGADPELRREISEAAGTCLVLAKSDGGNGGEFDGSQESNVGL